MAENLGFVGPLTNQAADHIKKLYNLFLKIDATQVEVNPFGETPQGQVVCSDAKINFDDDAEFRQKDIFAMDDKSENDEPIENEAARYHLKYIGLDGNIACFVNGAGLAMATCDIIFLNGRKPANFLDPGGGVKEAQVYQAFKLLTADPKVEAILVNIFGGIINCVIIANGITKACRELELKVPLVVRLEGTNVHEAQNILSYSGLPITSAVNLEDAAKKAVASVAKKWWLCLDPSEEEVHFPIKKEWFSHHYEENGYPIRNKQGEGMSKNPNESQDGGRGETVRAARDGKPVMIRANIENLGYSEAKKRKIKQSFSTIPKDTTDNLYCIAFQILSLLQLGPYFSLIIFCAF
ncbi:Succinate--CoA ligase [GDP-forming] subunit beta, mitochondrial [Manis javanica]|nr:Succinate--CoA ligase [GDP-forming] subunit beta, mitochondrial [Manis javanica]